MIAHIDVTKVNPSMNLVPIIVSSYPPYNVPVSAILDLDPASLPLIVLKHPTFFGFFTII